MRVRERMGQRGAWGSVRAAKGAPLHRCAASPINPLSQHRQPGRYPPAGRRAESRPPPHPAYPPRACWHRHCPEMSALSQEEGARGRHRGRLQQRRWLGKGQDSMLGCGQQCRGVEARGGCDVGATGDSVAHQCIVHCHIRPHRSHHSPTLPHRSPHCPIRQPRSSPFRAPTKPALPLPTLTHLPILPHRPLCRKRGTNGISIQTAEQ